MKLAAQESKEIQDLRLAIYSYMRGMSGQSKGLVLMVA